MSSELTELNQKKATQTLIALWEHDSVADAAKALGISDVAVYKRINNWGLKDKIREMNTMGEVVLQMGTAKAASNLISKLDSGDDKISLEASKEVLDRTGLTKVSDTSNTVNVNFNQFVAKEREQFDIT